MDANEIIEFISKSEKKTIDWNLNIFNNYTVDLFSEFEGVETVFLSPELNYEQLTGIKSRKVKKGIVIYGYLMGMYIEYPIFDKEYNRIMVLEGFCYSPADEKRDVMFELESIIKSVQIIKRRK